jgi:membrane protein DedA with SNARE-associated domain
MEIEKYIDFIKSNAYLIIFLGLILENTLFLGFIIPGLSLLMIGGFFAATGDTNIYYVFILGLLGTIIGDNLSLSLGRLISGVPSIENKVKSSKKIHEIIAYIENHQTKKMYFFHFPVYLRTIVPFSCGLIRFNFSKWIKIDLIGAVLFNLTFIFIGYITGNASGIINNALSIGGYVQLIFFIFFTIIIIKIIKRFIKK